MKMRKTIFEPISPRWRFGLVLTSHLAVVAAMLVLASTVMAREPELSDHNYKNGPSVRLAFSKLVAGAKKSTIRLRHGNDDVALATVVDANGLLLTKASQLKDDIAASVGDRWFPVKTVATFDRHDLALLKIDAKGLTPANWSSKGPLGVGQWVATAGLGRIPAAVGVVSVGRRKIAESSGILGIAIEQASDGPRVTQVFPGSGAEKAGLKTGDVIRQVDGRRVPTRQRLVMTVRKYHPGSVVTVLLSRGAKNLEVTATLGHVQDLALGGRAHPHDDAATGKLSRRRNGFPTVFQHDSLLKPTDCGGPLVDLSGKVVGVNIARAGRTSSFAIPASVVQEVIKDWQKKNKKVAGK